VRYSSHEEGIRVAAAVRARDLLRGRRGDQIGSPSITSTTTTTAPTATTTPQQEAAATYFFVVGNSNAELQDIKSRYVDPASGDIPEEKFQSFCREYAENGQAFVQRLSTAAFPPQYQTAVNDLVAKASVATSLMFECSKAAPGDLSASFPSDLNAAITAQTQAVDALRGLLGLPIER
jgi:hypothetical protein